MNTPNKTYIAYVRLTDEDKEALSIIVNHMPGKQTDHIRQAVKEYCARTLKAIAQREPAHS